MKYHLSSSLCALFVSAAVGSVSTPVQAGEAEARALLKAMSDYMVSQKAISFSYDTGLEVVTSEKQKIMLASSGTMAVSRPDKIRVNRTGGFADVEFVYDGTTLSVLGKNKNVYLQVEKPGTYYQLIDELRDKFNKPLPGADLLLENVNDVLMEGATDVKDLGSGVIGGQECDHIAVRTAELDWQIWIAQGDRPYPCRYVITSSMVDQAPQFSVDIQDWEASGDASSMDFAFKAPEGAKKLDIEELKDMVDLGDLPGHFTVGEAK